MSELKIINRLQFVTRDIPSIHGTSTARKILQQQPAIVKFINGEVSIEVGEWEDVPMTMPAGVAS